MNTMQEYLTKVLNMFTWISTMIFIFSGIFILIFWGPETLLGLSYVFGVLGISAACALVGAPIISMENAGTKKYFIFQTLYFLFTNLMVLATGFLLKWFSPKDKIMVAGFEATIIFVYAIITLICRHNAKTTARKMNERLRKFFTEN